MFPSGSPPPPEPECPQRRLRLPPLGRVEMQAHPSLKPESLPFLCGVLQETPLGKGSVFRKRDPPAQ